MPRGIKGSGKVKAGTKTDAKTNRMASVRTENTEGIAQVEPNVAVLDAAKGRKPYPTHEERLAAAEKQITVKNWNPEKQANLKNYREMANGLNPEVYLSHLLSILTECFASDLQVPVADLMSWNQRI